MTIRKTSRMVWMILGLLVCSDIPGFAEESSHISLYGYIANYTAASLNIDAEDSDDAVTFGDVLHLRLKGDWQPEETLKFHLECSYFSRIGNQNRFVQAESLGLSTVAQNADPTEDFTQEFVLDHAWGLANIGPFDLQFGKLPVSWGPGYVFNPTNRLNAVSALDEVNEETPGFVGFLGSYALPRGLSLSGYLSFNDKSRKKQAIPDDADFDAYPFGLKLQGYVQGYDISLSFIKEVLYTGAVFEQAYYAGSDFVGMLGDWIGIYGEGALRLPRDGAASAFDGVFGIEYTFDSDLELKAEYFHQGTGVSRTADYDVSDLLLGRRSVLAKDYVAAFVERSFWDFYTATIGGIINLNDGSYVTVSELQYDPKSNFQIMAGLNWLAGGDGTEFNGEFRLPTEEINDVSDPLAYVKLKLSF